MEAKYILSIIILASVFSCSPSKNKTISDFNNHHNLLIYINENPEIKELNDAIEKYFYLEDKYVDSIKPPVSDCFTSCVEIYIDENSHEIHFLDFKTSLDSIRYLANKVLINEDNDVLYPGKTEIIDSNGIKLKISKGHFKIYYNEAYLSTIQEVLIRLRLGFNDYKSHVSNQYYNSNYIELGKRKRYYLDSLFVERVGFKKHYPVLQPPPPEVIEIIEE